MFPPTVAEWSSGDAEASEHRGPAVASCQSSSLPTCCRETRPRDPDGRTDQFRVSGHSGVSANMELACRGVSCFRELAVGFIPTCSASHGANVTTQRASGRHGEIGVHSRTGRRRLHQGATPFLGQVVEAQRRGVTR